MPHSTREEVQVLLPTTPNFSVDRLGKHAVYVAELSKRYKALSQDFKEEPPSPPHGTDGVDEDRISRLRSRVQDAWVNADGNPADGKWALLTNMVRLGSTLGRKGHWAGARTDLELAPKPEGGWLNATSQAEWKEWEKKYRDELKVKDKVENWQKNLMAVGSKERTTKPTKASGQRRTPLPGRAQKSAAPTAKQAAPSVDPLNESNPLGFKVVKRSSQTIAANSKPAATTSKPTRHSKEPAAPPANIQEVSDLPNLSFRPPAFATSTPKPAKTKTPPPHFATSSPLPGLTSSLKPSSPRAMRAIPRSPNTHPRISSSLPAIPTFKATSSTKACMPEITEDPESTNVNNKRPADTQHPSPNDDLEAPPAKKPRTSSEEEVEAALQKPASNEAVPVQPLDIISTPKKTASTALPTLTELLASSKTKKKTPNRKSKPPGLSREALAKDFSTEVPETVDESASNPYIFEPFVDAGARHESPDMPLAVDDHLNVDEDLLLADQLEYDLASPTKSLSSLAGSDEEDQLADDDDLPGLPAAENIEIDFASPFRPLATSTQVPRGPFMSKVNLNPASQQQAGQSSNAVDSWESIYASAKPGFIPKLSQKQAAGVPPSSAGSSRNFFAPSSSNGTPKPSFPVYNSQFERRVGAHVDQVDKLLEKDVEFDKWVHDPYGGEEEDKDEEKSDDEPLGEAKSSIGRTGTGTGFSARSSLLGGFGQNGSEYGYGYGKAYDYDESR